MSYSSYDTPSEFFGPGYQVADNEIQLSTNSNAGVTIGTFTVDTATNVITTSAAHNLRVGHVVTVSSDSALPNPLLTGVRYWVKTVPSVDTLTLSAVSGGADIDITSVGTGEHTMVCPAILTNLSSGDASTSTAQVVFAIVDLISSRLNSIPLADKPTKFTISRSGYTDFDTGEMIYNYSISCRVVSGSLIAINS